MKPARIVIFPSILAISVMILCGCGPIVNEPVNLAEYAERKGVFNGKEFAYRIYRPNGLSESEKPPVALYLHGAGNRGSDNVSQLNGLHQYISNNKEKIKFIMVIPQLPEGRFWDADSLELANAALDSTVAEYNGDPGRLSAMGFSLGGNGVWSLAVMYPGKFAALIPMAARVKPTEEELPKVAKEVAETANDPNVFAKYAEKVGNTAVWIFHGLDDDIVSDGEAHAIQDAMRTGGNKKAQMTMVVRGGHSPLAFDNAEFYEWVLQQRKE